MSFRLHGKTGTEVLAHRHEAVLNLLVLGVGIDVPLGHIVADAQQQAKRLDAVSYTHLTLPTSG